MSENQTPEFLINCYAGDVGGMDLSFEADTREEAVEIARRENPRGARPATLLQLVGEDYEFVAEIV